MNEVFIDYNKAEMSANKMSESADIIKSDSKKLDELISDLNNYWKGSASQFFSKKMIEYIELFQKSSNIFQEKSDTLKLSKKTYEKFENQFLNMEI